MITFAFPQRILIRKLASFLDFYSSLIGRSPGGDNDLVVYQLAHFGFHLEKAENTIHGIAQSIIRAHSQLQEATLRYIEGPLYGAHINRVPKAYLENPKQERQLYSPDETLDTMTDPMMRVLRITAEDESWWKLGTSDTGNKDLGLIGFFAVHPTSLNNTNHYISGDNKGIASYLVEKSALSNAGPFWKTNSTTKSSSTNGTCTDGFVAAFPLPPSGDVSPNTRGAFCLDSGKACLVEPTLCEGGIKMCHGRGPVLHKVFGINPYAYLL